MKKPSQKQKQHAKVKQIIKEPIDVVKIVEVVEPVEHVKPLEPVEPVEVGKPVEPSELVELGNMSVKDHSQCPSFNKVTNANTLHL